MVDVVWYKKLRSTCGSVIHSGDNLTGVGDGDDEVISVNLAEIPFHVDRLLFTVCIFSYGVSFSQVGACLFSQRQYQYQGWCPGAFCLRSYDS